MRTLARGPAPEVLKKNSAAWTARYSKQRADDSTCRPEHRHYGHPKVREELRQMSHDKCFYCEQGLAEGDEQVDHYIEASLAPEKAFEWENLYLSCKGCNQGKPAHDRVPVTECLNPCDPAAHPEEHLAFDDEFIFARGQSARGSQTIRKYRLDRPDLNYRRAKALQTIYKMLDQCKSVMIRSGRKRLMQEEWELFRSYAQPQRPFSLMFESYLKLRPEEDFRPDGKVG